MTERKSIVDVANDLGLHPKNRGLRYSCRCPIHSDTQASLMIYPDTNSFYCFGCNMGGDEIALVMFIEECNRDVAFKKLGYEYDLLQVIQHKLEAPKLSKVDSDEVIQAWRERRKNINGES